MAGPAGRACSMVLHGSGPNGLPIPFPRRSSGPVRPAKRTGRAMPASLERTAAGGPEAAPSAPHPFGGGAGARKGSRFRTCGGGFFVPAAARLRAAGYGRVTCTLMNGASGAQTGI